MCNVTLIRVPLIIVAVRNNKYYIFWVCVCSLSYPAPKAHAPYYVYCDLWHVRLYHIVPTLLHKRHEFRGKKVFSTKSVFWFSLRLLSETFLILRRTERDIIIKSVCKVPLFLSDFNETRIFSADFRKILKYISWKSSRLEPSCSTWRNGQKDVQPDVTELTFAFRNFANAPKKRTKYHLNIFLMFIPFIWLTIVFFIFVPTQAQIVGPVAQSV